MVETSRGPRRGRLHRIARTLLEFVIARLGQDDGEPGPEWFDERYRKTGWGTHGAALAEGLMAYVADIYRTRTGRPVWVLDEDPKNAIFRQPVMAVDLATRSPPRPPRWLCSDIATEAPITALS